MKTRDYWYRLRVADRISFAILMLIIIGLFWWVDSSEWDAIPTEWLKWVDAQFFLLEFAMIIAYYAIIIVIFELIHRAIKLLVREIMGL